ncbi:MAG TPA: helicase-related protein [Candidatus Cloacimonadota bacterium]|nr:helicase-related protein [Candidatus Cloacimonadota bacterium]
MQLIELRPGQIVNLRNRLWRIDAIYNQSKFIDLTRLDGYESEQRTFYLPKEINNMTLSDNSFPEIRDLGDPAWQKMYLQAWRLSLIFADSPFISLHKASIIPTKFQLVPVLIALKKTPVRLMIADDVGLGKTIEAGMIMSELMARQMIRKILIITPSNLREQWKEVMANCFHLNFEIMSQLSRKPLEREIPSDANPWHYYPRLITSIDYIKRDEQLSSAGSTDYDLVIVDEAHLCAKPHQISASASVMLRWKMLQTISKKAKNLMLLSATPHNGYRDSYASLLSVLNPEIVEDDYKINIEKAKMHVCQRTRNDLINWLSEDFNPFPDNSDKKVELIDLKDNKEIQIYNELIKYHETLSSLAVTDVKSRFQTDFLILHLLKRFISSPYALLKSLENRLEHLRFEQSVQIQTDQEETGSYITETDLNDSLESEETGQKIERNRFSEAIQAYEIETIQNLKEKLLILDKNKGSKYKYLKQTIIPELMNYDQHIILFTKYKDTLDFLASNLTKDLKDTLIFSVYGAMNYNSRVDVLEQFEKSQKGILLTTDCLSEGINLQYMSSCLIHYELPWNPNRLEQRNGRIDRYGQSKKAVHIRSVIVEDTIDNFILHKIIEKTEEIKKAYGFAPPFIPDDKKITEMLVKTKFRGKGGDDTSQITLGDYQNDLNIDIDTEWKEKIETIKSDSYYGHMHFTLPEIDEQVKKAERKTGSEVQITDYIKNALMKYDCDIDTIEEEVFSIRIRHPKLMLNNRKVLFERVTFSKEKAARCPGLELISIGHPLIERLNQVIITEHQTGHYSRISFTASDQINHTGAILQIKSTCLSGTKPPSVYEDLFSIGIDLFNQSLYPSELIEHIEQYPQYSSKQKEDIHEMLTFIQSDESIKNVINQAVQNHQQNSNILRKEELESLKAYDWANGVTDIQLVRYDILTIKIVFPAG